MHLNFIVKSGLAIIWLLSAAVSFAQERGTATEAKALVEKALLHVKSVGTEKAFKDFTDNTDGKWRSKDLYVFVATDDGFIVSHGASKGLVGKDIKDVRDSKGRAAAVDMAALSKSGNGTGWYDYEWTDPVTKKAAAKSAYFARISGFSGFAAVGVYK